MPQMRSDRRSKSLRWGSLAWLLCCFLAAFFVLAYPIYVIRPFRQQGPRELAVALATLQIGPYLQPALAVVAIALLLWCWRRNSGVISRWAASLATVAIVSFVFLARVNVYELLFKPVQQPTFLPAGKTKLSGQEQVIAIKVKATARAYPIRDISYHHIVNDIVAGLPVVATY